jgi:uncharacterized protein YdeI (YjbR/CyaY-like superfamily)
MPYGNPCGGAFLGVAVIENPAMADAEIVAPRDRGAWRRWLARNHARPAGVWLLIRKKGSTAAGVSYEDAVEEALCFGWIDGLANRHDDDHYKIWLSPRRPRSAWSARNKRRVADLAARGLIEPPGQAAIDLAKRNGSWDRLVERDSLQVPDDLSEALDANPPAREHFEAFPAGTRKQILGWIADAKRDETRAKRVAQTATLAARNIRVTQQPPA